MLERELLAASKKFKVDDEEEYAEQQLVELKLALLKSRKLLRDLEKEKELISWGIEHAEELEKNHGKPSAFNQNNEAPKGINMISFLPDGSAFMTNTKSPTKASPVLMNHNVNAKVNTKINTTNSILNSADKQKFVPLDEYQLKKKGKLEQKSINEAIEQEKARLDGIAKVYNNPGYSYEPDNVNTVKRGGIPGLFAGPSFNVNNTVAMNDGMSKEGYVWTEGVPFGIGEMGEWESRNIKSTTSSRNIVGYNIDEQFNNESRNGDKEVFNITYKRGYEPEDFLQGGKHEDAPDYDSVGVYRKRDEDEFHDDVKAGSGNTHKR